MFLWAIYDPDDNILYPNISNWDELLITTIEIGNYNTLSKDEILSLLFGIIHRNRVVEGLWWSMFERGVIKKLVVQLIDLDTD